MCYENGSLIRLVAKDRPKHVSYKLQWEVPIFQSVLNHQLFLRKVCSVHTVLSHDFKVSLKSYDIQSVHEVPPGFWDNTVLKQIELDTCNLLWLIVETLTVCNLR